MDAPETIGEFTVLEFGFFASPVFPLGYVPPPNGRPPLEPVQNLAICSAPGVDGFYLLYCTSEWKRVTFAFHETIEFTKRNPRIEFGCDVSIWRRLGPSGAKHE
jgi:hypothetical protein